MAEKSDEDNGIDFVCSLCDNGGEVASCEGRCLRSFHAIKGSSEGCQTLGYSRLQFNAMKVFLCKNCEYETYQCFACGRLGSAKMNHPEVFKCAVETCGHFYHANCVAQLLFPENDDKVREYTAMIANGAKFACPIHRCDICKYGENKEVKDLQFAVCRRCPKSYHRRCLPREIAFEDLMDNGQFVFQRAWDELLPNNRILLYCMKHDIDPETRTALRNHIIFPTDPATVRKPLNQLSGIKKNIVKVLQTDEHPPAALSSVKRSGAGKHASLNDLMKKKRRLPVSGEKPAVVEKKAVIPKIPVSSFPEIDRNTEMRIYELSQTAAAHITIEDVKKRLAVPFTYTQNLQNADNITLEMVERSSEAVKAALHMLENGASIEEAKTVCTPGDLIQIVKWKNKLNIYLAPILHGARYTSYGRHFTKLDKLQLIVDKVQWYIQNGDTVVDFCCGSNDFSLLMKEKLEASGKQCFYKNYDLIQPKNDFCFERRDWMTVQPDELPPGCRLIMGLNPPFGFKASLANQFINKALTFKPKLIILIVPKETERLDRKYPPYELIWEDSDQLSGKSFYLPGSFDADYKVMDQWNVSPPPLSLWSRSDWAKRHSEIARSKEHLPSENASYVDMQSEVTGHVEMSETIPATHMSHADKLFADTHNDATNSPGDFWTDTNSRSLQPCNYEAPGWFDPTQNHHSERRAESDMSMSSSDRADCQRPKHHLERRAESDMSISSSDRFDCERQDQSLSISEHGGAGPQACNAPKSAAAGKSTAPVDCEEVTSACGPYHLQGDLPLPPSGVQYWMMEDSPPVEEPAVGFLSRKPRDPRPARRLAFAAQYQRMEDTPPTGNTDTRRPL